MVTGFNLGIRIVLMIMLPPGAEKTEAVCVEYSKSSLEYALLQISRGTSQMLGCAVSSIESRLSIRRSHRLLREKSKYWHSTENVETLCCGHAYHVDSFDSTVE